MSCLRCDGLHSLDEADQELYDAGGVQSHLNIRKHFEDFMFMCSLSLNCLYKDSNFHCSNLEGHLDIEGRGDVDSSLGGSHYHYVMYVMR